MEIGFAVSHLKGITVFSYTPVYTHIGCTKSTGRPAQVVCQSLLRTELLQSKWHIHMYIHIANDAGFRAEGGAIRLRATL